MCSFRHFYNNRNEFLEWIFMSVVANSAGETFRALGSQFGIWWIAVRLLSTVHFLLSHPLDLIHSCTPISLTTICASSVCDWDSSWDVIRDRSILNPSPGMIFHHSKHQSTPCFGFYVPYVRESFNCLPWFHIQRYLSVYKMCHCHLNLTFQVALKNKHFVLLSRTVDLIIQEENIAPSDKCFIT